MLRCGVAWIVPTIVPRRPALVTVAPPWSRSPPTGGRPAAAIALLPLACSGPNLRHPQNQR